MTNSLSPMGDWSVDEVLNAENTTLQHWPWASDDQAVEQSFWRIPWQINHFCIFYVIAMEKKKGPWVIFLYFSCSLNVVVYYFTLCSCITLPLVWANLSESWGLEDVFGMIAIFSIWKQNVLAGKEAKRCFLLCWMSLPKISRKYWVVRSL